MGGIIQTPPLNHENSSKKQHRKLWPKYFGYWKGILVIDFLPRGMTINTERYCETILKLRHTILLTSSIVLLHNNASSHIAARAKMKLDNFHWELLDQYSPDLALSHFPLVLKLWLENFLVEYEDMLKKKLLLAILKVRRHNSMSRLNKCNCI